MPFQEAELTLMPVTVTELRKEVVEFSHLLGTTSFGMLVRRPEYTPKPDALLKPFNNEVRGGEAKGQTHSCCCC